MPTMGLRDLMTDFLLRHLGDPRFRVATWQSVPPHCKAIFRQWIARATLEEFFDVISDQTDADQWRYRRQFWLSVLRTGAVEDVWVVLGSDGTKFALKSLGNTIAYGRLSGGFANDQSVILLKINGLVFAEVSHIGALRVWPIGSKDAPVLGLETYHKTTLNIDGLDFPGSKRKGSLWHLGPSSFTWQQQAAKLLEQKTGLRLNRQDWAL